MANFNLIELFKKWFWPTARVVLPITLIAGGIIFVIFAIINQIIDVEAARYLLSAIVQALAALLAIIFAGVAILWGQAYSDNRKFAKHRREIEDWLVRKSRDQKGETILRFIINAISNDSLNYQKSEDSFELFKKRLWGYIKTIRMSLISPETAYKSRRKQLYDMVESIAERMDYSQSDIDDLRNESGTLYRLKRSHELIDSIIEGSKLFYHNQVCDINSTVNNTLQKFRDDVMVFNIEDLAETIHRARQARGTMFKILISLYTITITLGMILLSLLKAVSSSSNLCVSCIAAAPLFLAICAVALTFVYLARIITDKKE